MTLRCLAYMIYDWSKGTRLINRLFYQEPGKIYQHFEDIKVSGAVTAVKRSNTDGDVTFDISSWTEWGTLHCEITPCYPVSIDVLNRLQVGTWVTVAGTRTYDPTHLGIPGHWEIHPVKTLVVN